MKEQRKVKGQRSQSNFCRPIPVLMTHWYFKYGFKGKVETELILEGLGRNKPKDIPDDKTGLCVCTEGQSLVAVPAVLVSRLIFLAWEAWNMCGLFTP